MKFSLKTTYLKNLKRLALLAFLIFSLSSAVLFVTAEFSTSSVFAEGITDVPDPTQCDDLSKAEDPNCAPPTLKLIEIWAVKALYIIWAFGGIIFGLGLAVIGFSWLTSGGDPQKLEELKKKATYWAISIPVFFGGYPVILFVLTVFPLNTDAQCYSQLNQPMFQIIFPDACNQIQVRYDPDPSTWPACNASNEGQEITVSDVGCRVCDNRNWVQCTN